MTAYVALLRAVNVAGRNRIAMPALLDLLQSLGLAGGRSLLQSGNLVFRSDYRTGTELERLLEAETERHLQLNIHYLVRTADEWMTIVARNPFRDEADRDPRHLVVMMLRAAPAREAVGVLHAAIPGPERVHIEDKQAYVVYPDGIGRSKLTNSLIEKKLGTRATGRNWNTVLKLADLLHA